MVNVVLNCTVSCSNFTEFYTYYMALHAKPVTRRCHLAGTVLAAGCLVVSVIRGIDLKYALAAPVLGYGIAWTGDAAVEGIKPTSFRHPWWSFLANMKLVKEIVTGKQSL